MMQSTNTVNVFFPTKPSCETFSFFKLGSSLSSIPKAALEHCRFALEVDKTEIMQLSQLRNKGVATLGTWGLEADPLFSGLEGLLHSSRFFFLPVWGKHPHLTCLALETTNLKAACTNYRQKETFGLQHCGSRSGSVAHKHAMHLKTGEFIGSVSLVTLITKT